MSADKNEALWRKMIRRSFHPRQWFEDDGAVKHETDGEALAMWVFINHTTGYQVGFFTPAGRMAAGRHVPDQGEGGGARPLPQRR